jgi:hypothetical protein
MKKQDFLINDEFEQLSNSDLINFVNNGLLLEKAKSLYFLAKRCKNEKNIIDLVREKIFDSNNKKSKLLGTVTISFLGIRGLVEADTLETKKIIDDFMKTLSAEEYKNLVDFLN